MKKLWLLTVVLFLFGCGASDSQMDRTIYLREKLLNCDGCSFTAEITADFGEKIYTFTLDCQGNKDGSLAFEVQKPDTISGIQGILSANGGKTTFEEDRCVAFPMLAEGEITPVSGPWVLYTALCSGYILACGMEGDLLRMTLNDTYEDEALQLDVWLDSDDRPVTAEIFWKGCRVLTIRVTDFQIL